MRPLTRLFATTALTTALTASTAVADVTADDVWSNIRAYMDAFGPAISVETARNGKTLTVSDIALNWQLPFDVGSIALSQTGFDLVETGDGTVAIAYKDAIEVAVDVEITGEGGVHATLVFSPEGMFTIASGQPNKVLYTYGAERMGITASRFEITEGQNPQHLDINGDIGKLTGEVTIETGSQVIVDGTASVASQAVEVTNKDEHVSFVYGLEAGVADSKMRYVLPTGGMEIMNLAAAFERGLSFDITSNMAGYATRQVIEGPDGLISDQRSAVKQYDLDLKLDRDGLRMNADTAGVDNLVSIPDLIPLPIEIRAEAATGTFAMPISAGEDLQGFEFSGTALGLEVNEPLWGLIDPEGLLPRDPATLRIGLTGKVKSFVDLFNFADFAARMEAGEVPGELHEVTLNTLELSAAGARVTGEGNILFDNTDLQTFGGFPKPVGGVDVMVQGANGLMDTLVKLGLLSDQDMMGARMMMGMVAKPDPEAGEDVLRSRIDLTDEGHVLANGMRLK